MNCADYVYVVFFDVEENNSILPLQYMLLLRSSEVHWQHTNSVNTVADKNEATL